MIWPLYSLSQLNSHFPVVPMSNHAKLAPGPTVHLILCVSVSLLPLSLSSEQSSPFIYQTNIDLFGEAA